METESKRISPKKVAIIAVAAIAVGLLLWWLSTLITPDELQAWIRGFGAWAPLAYIFLIVVLPIFFMPVAPLAMMGGLLFGLWRGYLYTIAGCVINCALMYWMTQRLGKDRIQRFLQNRLSPQWLARIKSLEGRTGFFFLIVLRLTALIPYNVINYAFGLTNMKFKDFMLASIIGIVPDMLIYVNMGDKALDITSPDFWLAFALLAIFIIASLVLMWWFFPRSKGEIAFTPLPGEEDAGALPAADPLEPEQLQWLMTGAGTRAPSLGAGVREALVGVRGAKASDGAAPDASSAAPASRKVPASPAPDATLAASAPPASAFAVELSAPSASAAVTLPPETNDGERVRFRPSER